MIKYPKGEIIWVSYLNRRHGLRFIITSKPIREYYFLYEVVDDEFVKLGKAKTPIELEEKFNISNKLSR